MNLYQEDVVVYYAIENNFLYIIIFYKNKIKNW